MEYFMKDNANINNIRLEALRQLTNISDCARVVDEQVEKSKARGYYNRDMEAVVIVLTDAAHYLDAILTTYHQAMAAADQGARIAESVAYSSLRALIDGYKKNEVSKEGLIAGFKSFVK